MGQNKAHSNRQRKHVSWISHRYPTAWQQADQIRRDQRHAWPAWCYLPIEHWYAIAKTSWPQGQPTVEKIVDVMRLAALGAWRITQGVYRFDPDLYSALINTPLTGDLPDDLLYRLPTWGLYLETPGLTFDGCPLLGVYAHLDDAPHDGHTELRLVLDSDTDLRLFPIPMRLGHGSLQNAVQAISDLAQQQMENHGPESRGSFQSLAEKNAQDAHDLAPILSLLLYLCADEADYPPPPKIHTVRPRSLGGERLVVVPEQVSYWEVGARIGAAIRSARTAEPTSATPAELGDRARPRPHWRRAHWHTFWTGGREGERRARVKWLPPIAVNVDGQELPIVIHPVSGLQVR